MKSGIIDILSSYVNLQATFLVDIGSVVERVIEVARLMLSHGIVIVFAESLFTVLETTILALWAVAIIVAAIIVAIATLVVVAALTTLRTRTTLTLHISLGFRDEHTVREFVLACLGVNLEQFHIDLITLFEASLFNGV